MINKTIIENASQGDFMRYLTGDTLIIILFFKNCVLIFIINLNIMLKILQSQLHTFTSRNSI